MYTRGGINLIIGQKQRSIAERRKVRLTKWVAWGRTIP